MIKALLALLIFTKVIDSGSQTYQIFYAFGDALFSFLPFILAFSAARYFKCNPYVAAVLAGILLHSSFTALEAPIKLFEIIPVTKVSYGGSVVPILLIVWAQSYIERFANKISPKAVKIFLVPMLTIIVTGILGITIAGPLGNLVGQVLALGFNWLNDYAGWVIPFLMGTFCPFFVMTGMHYCFSPIQTIQYATLGYGTILGPGMLASNVAQGTASIVVGLRSKNKNLKQLGLSAGFTGLMGITEPALYGVTLKYKRPLYAAMIGGGVAGLYAGITGIHTYSSTAAGLLALPVYVGGDGLGNVINAALTIVISMVVTSIATLILGFNDPVEETAADAGTAGAGAAAGTAQTERFVSKQDAMAVEISSPLNGTAIALEEVGDEVFAKGIVGKGAAVIPSEGKLYAPASGIIENMFETKHAVEMRLDGGIRVLLHIGLDTVELKGEHFTAHVKTGDTVKKGQLLVEFDMDAIKAAGYKTVTSIVISNTADYPEVSGDVRGEVKAGDALISVLM